LLVSEIVCKAFVFYVFLALTKTTVGYEFALSGSVYIFTQVNN